MKTFSVAVAVAVVLACIYIQESSAFPFTGVQEPVSNDNPVAEPQETSADSWMMPIHFRQKRHSSPFECRFCCNCCQPGVCGMCCSHRF